MPVNKLTQVTCMTGLMLGKLASTATAQAIETDLSSAPGEATTGTAPQSFTASDQTTSTQGKTGSPATVTEPETITTPETALTRKTAEVKPKVVTPPTASVPSSKTPTAVAIAYNTQNEAQVLPHSANSKPESPTPELARSQSAPTSKTAKTQPTRFAPEKGTNLSGATGKATSDKATRTFTASARTSSTQSKSDFLSAVSQPETITTPETAPTRKAGEVKSNTIVPRTASIPSSTTPAAIDRTQNNQGEARLLSQSPPPKPKPSIPVLVTPEAKPIPIAVPELVTPEAKSVPAPVPELVTPEAKPIPIAVPELVTPEAKPVPVPVPVVEIHPLKFLPRIGGSVTTGPGVGYSDSFGSIEGFVPLSQIPARNLTFLEGRLLVPIEGSGVGGNLVLGHRFYDPKSDRIYGGYVAYDHRNTGDSSFNQIGLGLETLGKTWDVRANAYLPIGETRQLAGETTSISNPSFSDPFFQQNFLGVTRTQEQRIDRRYEAALAGFDLEAGVKLAKLGETGDLKGYGGVYYYDGPGTSGTLGWRTRLEARPTDTFRLGLSLSGDEIFGTQLVLNAGVNFPGTRPRVSKKKETIVAVPVEAPGCVESCVPPIALKEPVAARLGEWVNRNPNIAVDEQIESQRSTLQETVFLTNPVTGQPWTFRHVNLGIGAGDGTFENPTGTVAEALAIAQPNEIVYVQPGTNPGIPAFTIPDGVQVLSTGPVQTINTVEIPTVQLPLSGAGTLPTVNGTVTLGNDTTLSGFAITAIPGPGITGTNISNVIVRDNAIANSAAEGILLNNVNGQVAVTNNTINNSSLEGFSLNNDAGQVDLTLTGNNISGNGASAADGDGVNIELRNTASGTFNVADNSITNNSGSGGIADGVDIKLFDATSGAFNIANNSITGNQLNGVSVDLESTAQGTFNLTGNTVSDNGNSGLSALFSDDAQGTFNLDGNTISNNQLKGVELIFAERTSGTANLTNNTISNNQDDGVYVQLSDAAQGTVNLSTNSITNNGRFGVYSTNNGTAQLRFLADSNIITDNAFTGLSLNTSDSANTIAAILSNTLTGGGFGDLEVFTITPSATTCLQPRNNTINSLLLDDSFGGPIRVEEGTLPTNNISNSNLTFWSGTTAPANSCSF